MKVLLILVLIKLSILTVQANDVESLKLNCLASDGSSFLIDQFQNDPCRIRKIKNEQIEDIVNVSLCLFPNDIHDSFSFWWFVPNQSKAELIGELNLVMDKFVGSLGYTTASSASGLAFLDCKIE